MHKINKIEETFMGKKRKRRIDNKSGSSEKAEGYERYQYGPLMLERIGRHTHFSSHWDPAEFKKFKQYIKDHRPEQKAEIDKEITEVQSLIKKYDPLKLLSTVAFKNGFADPESYSEPSHEGKEPYIEYAQSIVLASDSGRVATEPTDEVINRFHELIGSIYNNVTLYFGSEITEEKRSFEEETIRYMALLQYLFLRGYSTQEHHIELIRDLFSAHNSFLQKHISASTKDIIGCVEDIERQLSYTMNEKLLASTKLMMELHSRWKVYVDAEGVEKFRSMQDCMTKFKEQPGIQEMTDKLLKVQRTIPELPFVIEATEKAPENLLEMLSSEIGDNRAFSQFAKAPAWPTNDSIIYRKPLIKCEKKYYCFAFQVLFRNLKEIVENWINDADNDYFEHTYQESRANLLEEKAIQYLNNLLPGAKIYRNLYYSTGQENQEKHRSETDAIIIFDENLFILEAKAGALSLSAKRGGLDRIKRDTTALVDEAYSQAIRTKAFILETEAPIFKYENGQTALELTGKRQYKNIFLINVTLEYLGHLSTQLNSLKKFELINGKEWPWSVFINDLRIISELIQSPSEFLLYIQRRIRANDYPQFHTFDELDYLMYFFSQGLYFEDDGFGDISLFTLHGYTVPLERFYDFQAGRASTGEKPALFIKEKYRELVRNIERTEKTGFSLVGSFLLSLDSETQDGLLSDIERLNQLVAKDGQRHTLTLLLKHRQGGFAIGMGPTITDKLRLEMEDFTRLKKYQTRVPNWILLMLGKDTAEIDFVIFGEPWKYDEALEQKVEHLSKIIVKKKLDACGKVGRNDPCPCNSGRKYKKCCWGKV
jgi:hypothetical protein